MMCCTGMFASTFISLFLLIQGLRALPLSTTHSHYTIQTPEVKTALRYDINETKTILQMSKSQFDIVTKSVESIIMKIREASLGYPSESVGETLKSWQPGEANPEEMGSYIQGDVLHLPENGDRNGLKELKFRWPKGVIPFRIEGDFNEKQLDKIQTAIEEYHKHTCIRFVEHTDEEDFINIESSTTGCWSSLGRVGGMQTVNFQTPMCLYYTGTIIHEFMHTIGFFHEQSRIDRDQFIDIDWSNVVTGREFNFNKYESLTFGKAYDYASVMHYSNLAFSKNAKPSIVPKANGVTIGQRRKLSDIDIDKINAMYKCSGEESHLL